MFITLIVLCPPGKFGKHDLNQVANSIEYVDIGQYELTYVEHTTMYDEDDVHVFKELWEDVFELDNNSGELVYGL